MSEIIFTFIFLILALILQFMPFIIIIFIIYIVKKANSNNKSNNLQTSIQNSSTINTTTQGKVLATTDPIYETSIDNILSYKINEELQINNINPKVTIPYIEKRKNIFTIIFCIVTFLIICLFFFHFNITLSLIILEIVNILIYLNFTRKYTIIQYLKKQIKARPDEKISNIVSAFTQETYISNSQYLRYSFIALTVILPLIIFIKPITLYEQTDEGYFVRFHTLGLTNNKVITIPENYKSKPVIGIRGNVFANLKSVEEINLPDTIKEIRGKAFANDKKLKNIKLPNNLEYLGGSAFYNCTSLERIIIPTTVTEINGNTFENCESLEYIELHDNITSIHGSAFLNCTSLKNIKLPSNITEIRGNTFENCTSLTSIEIPDKVTRIGGHAFRGCSSLSEVKLPDGLQEIGSSAFRECYALKNIRIPKATSINERAFKDTYVIIEKY